MVKKFLIMILFLAVIVGVFGVNRYVRSTPWDGKNRFNFLFLGPPDYLVSFVPKENKVFLLPASEVEVKTLFLDQSLPIVNFCFHDPKEVKKCVISQFTHQKQNLDNLRFWWYAARLDETQFVRVTRYNGEARDEEVVRENLALAVVNTTGENGLAAWAGNVISINGGRLVRLLNAEERLLSCQLRGESRALKSYTARRLQHFFKCSFKQGSVENYRADLVLFLGENNLGN